MKRALVKAVERVLNCRIYRTTLPRGTDLEFDLKRDFKIGKFQTIFDVGANVGQSAHAYRRMFPQAEIHCFEPVQSAFAELERSTARLHGVKRYQLALGDSSGEIEVHVNADSRLSSIRTRRPGDAVERVQLATLSKFCADNGIAHVDFLKIDTEGFELSVLGGGLDMLVAQAIDLIQIECAPAARSGYFVGLGEVIDVIGPAGYELYGIYEQTPHWTGRNAILYFNAVFVSPRYLSAPSFVDSMMLGGVPGAGA